MTVGEYIEWPVKALLVATIRFYQRWISPVLPPMCRFYPTCSNYALEALHSRRLAPALILIAWRLARCQPLCRGGYDPVPHTAKSRERE